MDTLIKPELLEYHGSGRYSAIVQDAEKLSQVDYGFTVKWVDLPARGELQITLTRVFWKTRPSRRHGWRLTSHWMRDERELRNFRSQSIHIAEEPSVPLDVHESLTWLVRLSITPKYTKALPSPEISA